MEKHIHRWLEDIPVEKGIVVALSGGPDSVAVLCLLASYRKKQSFPLVAAILHHGLRENADKDVEFCRALTQRLEVPLYEKWEDVPTRAREWGMSFEMAGRKARHLFFQDVLTETNLHFLATGHHRQDQAETILLRILRGTGVDGLVGMEQKDGSILRPLLPYTKKEIIEYLENVGQTYCFDETNQETDYGRNRVRLELLPVLEQFNPNILGALETLSANAKDASVLLWDDARSYLEEHSANSSEILLPHTFLEKSPAFRRNILRACMVKLKGDAEGLSRKQIEEVDRLIHQGSGREKKLHDLYIAKTQKGILLKIDTPFLLGSLPIQPTNATFGRWTIRIEKAQNVSEDRNDPYVFYLPEEWAEKTIIRARRQGDWIQPFGMNGTKSIAHLMKDEKIRVDLRDQWPLLAMNDEVFWVMGIKKSERTRDLDSKSYFRIEMKEDTDARV